MLNFVIVEDNNIHRKKIHNVIVTSMMENRIEYKIYEFNDYSKSLIKYISNDLKDTIYILDLELPNGDGIDITRIIRNEYNNWISPIVIITAHTSLYYEVYKQRLQVLDFIGKCENIEKNLKENIDICLRMLNKEKVYRYIYKNIEYTINISQIDFIQRDGRQIKIVTKGKIYYQNKSIVDIMKYLPGYFIKSSKGTLINMKNVKEIDWTNLLVYFKDGLKDYLVSNSHKKEIINYE